MPLATLLLLAAAQAQHDPPVIRCAFEDRSRMVLFNPTPGLWMAFNPTTCTLQKVWEGDVEWKGKVFDFSQDNSKAKGKVLYEAPSTLVKLEDGRPGDWKLTNVSWKDGWNFSARSTIESPLFETAQFTRLCVMFDETSRKGSVRAEIVGEDGQVQSWFDSTKHGHSDTDWQFNMKLLPDAKGKVKLRVTQPGDFGKTLRKVRVFADWKSWSASSNVLWKGYRIDKGRGTLTCLAEYPAANGIQIEQEFGADASKWWIEVRSTQSEILSYPHFMFKMTRPIAGAIETKFPLTEFNPFQSGAIVTQSEPLRVEFKR